MANVTAGRSSLLWILQEDRKDYANVIVLYAEEKMSLWLPLNYRSFKSLLARTN